MTKKPAAPVGPGTKANNRIPVVLNSPQHHMALSHLGRHRARHQAAMQALGAGVELSIVTVRPDRASVR